jgi:DUF1707 SHOCT-like domain
VLTDAERDRAARLLRERYANGALTLAELDAQLAAVLAAASEDEVHALLHDQRLAELPVAMLGADVAGSDVESLGGYLALGERPLWIGHPHPRSQLSAPDIFVLPFALFAAFLFGTGVLVVPWPLTLLMLLLFVGSLQMLVGRFVFPSRRRRRTIYAVTDRRVISLLRRRWLHDRVRELYLTAIPRITIHRGRSSRGTLRFGDAPRYEELSLLEQAFDDKSRAGVGFYNVEDPETIESLVETARQHSLHGPAPAPTSSRQSRG